MIAILKTPLFWRVAPLLGLTSGVQIGIQTLWAGPMVPRRDGPQPRRRGPPSAVAWPLPSWSASSRSGIIADRLGRRGIGPMQVMLGFNVIYFIAQAIIVLRIEALMFPAWLCVAAFGQVAVLAFPWFAAHIGKELAGRANATINFTMFVAAFASQYLVGSSSGCSRQPPRATARRATAGRIGIFLVVAAGGLRLVSRGLPTQGT